MGLSNEDRQILINNVNIVLHSAATLDFNQPLKPTVNINILGTRRVVKLCTEIKDLKVKLKFFKISLPFNYNN